MASYIVKIHPTLGIAVRSDGYVAIRKRGCGGGVMSYHWTAGSTFSNGYKVVTISYKRYSVHRLVAQTFIPNPENKPAVDHINRIRDDNRVENLRWATSKENNNNSIAVLNRTDYGVRFCDNPNEYKRLYRKANAQKILAYKREVYARKKAQGLVFHCCPDRKRRWHKPGECPACH